MAQRIACATSSEAGGDEAIMSPPWLLFPFTYPTDIEAGTEYECQEHEDGD